MTIIHKSPFPTIEIPALTVTAYILRNADEVADKNAFVEGDSGRTVSFGELKTLIHSFAGGLAADGFGVGDTLALVSPNLPEYAVIFHGTAVAGGTVTTINPTYSASEMRFQLNDAAASRLVTTPQFVSTALEAIKGTNVKKVVVIGEHPKATPLTQFLGEPIEQVPVDVNNHVVVLPYSSGTTGLPKGVMLTHSNLVANLAQSNAVLQYNRESSGIAALPFFHIYGMQLIMNVLLSNGCTVITMTQFHLPKALELIQNQKITHFYAVPPMILALAKHPIVSDYDLSSLQLIMCGAAPLGTELAEAATNRIGCEIIQAYGMTELSPVSHLMPPGQFRPGSAGITVPNTECRIVDLETKEDQPAGGKGEVWIRGPMIMAGYHNKLEATAATIDSDGWLHTGDVGTIDEHQNLYIVDRAKELIKYKGFQVAPAELEAKLITHPSVADVAVVGFPDEEAGEIPKAFVILKPGATVSKVDLIAFAADNLASYKKIRLVEFIDEIPKSASGKILRRLLREQ